MSNINLKKGLEKMKRFLRNKLDETGAQGYTIGVSGGLDSAVTLKIASQALNKEKIRPWIMPGNPSKEKNIKDAKNLTNKLNLEPKIINIEEITQLFNKKTPFNLSKNTLGNLRARIRMNFQYIDSNENNTLVLGAGNRTELLLGYFTKYGDEAVDVQILRCLYKTEVREVAKIIDLPNKFIEKQPTAGLWKGQTDESELGATYKEIDKILKHLIEFNYSTDEIAKKTKIDKQKIEKIKKLHIKTQHKRNTPDYPRLRNLDIENK
ncbi:MAG: NH3-dependent NAD+ synthetase NadE [Candidatus Methanohalarchaeum thermophilum]|uniref:NH(3)-dependent NAD(+) synthetase n=1 Tax=Methanohalarchaeum thermophilum TaxID=1903181 RepID=A0A1Q6DSF9_METT1|nr:MAG: NH3-dependent NAD+ synthetase NadE [Candidatus Methanohalarchaeum thermophilum]